MLPWIVGASLRARRFVLGLAAVVASFGIWHLRDLRADVLPEFGPPTVEVQTEALGLAPAEVEQLITVPLEQDLLNGLPWLDAIRSRSLPGLSSIDLVFSPGTDLLRAREVVQERLTQAHALPNVSKPPQMIQPESSTSRVMMIGLTATDLSPIEMSVLARWTIRPRLMGVPGVSNVAIWGQKDQQLQVQVDPNRLRDAGVSLEQVVRTAGNALAVSPLSFLEASTPGTGGFIDTPAQRLGVQHVLPITTPADLAKVPLEDQKATPLRLGDVATVVEDHQPLIGDAVLAGGPGLILVVEKFPGANTLEVTRAVDAALDDLRPGLKGIRIDSSLFRPATYVQRSIDDVAVAAGIGALLLLLALAVFGSGWRRALAGFAAILLSLAGAAAVFYLRATTVDTMVLAGLVIALVVVVDDAVGDTDAILRRIRRDGGQGGPQRVAAVRAASHEMRSAMGYAVLITVVGALPIFLMRGFSGDAFLPRIALTYLLAVVVSMAVALTVTPALSLVLLSRAPPPPREPLLLRWVHRRHDRALGAAARRPLVALAAAGLVVASSLAVLPLLRSSLLPTFEEGDLLVHVEAAPGTSLPEMRRITALAGGELRALPGVRSVGAHVGRAVMSDRIVNVDSGDLWVGVDPRADYARTVAAVRTVVEGYPGLRSDVVTYSNDQTGTILTGPGKPLVVRVYGEDFGVLRDKAKEIEKLLSGVRGVVHPAAQLPPEEPTVQIEVDLPSAQRYGIKPGDVRRSATTLLSGVEVGSIFEDQKVFEVVVKGTPGTRTSPASVQDLVVDTPGGGHVRLGDVARVWIAPTPQVIRHEAVSRSVDVTADVRGRDLDAVMAETHDRLRQVSFPLEHHAELLGDFMAHRAAQRHVFEVSVAAAIGLLLLLQAAFGSWRLASLVFLTLPAALVGGVFGVLAGGGVVTIGSFVGFLAVLAVSARHSILLVRRLLQLERDGEPLGPVLVARGTRERLGPVLVTLAATALGLLPFVAAGSIPGTEVVRPAAVVVVSGLLTSALVTLVLVPALYLRFGPFATATAPGAEDEAVVMPGIAPVQEAVVADSTPLTEAQPHEQT
ncbi:MAG TPA: efflux RND transporter permease subunit [Actinomycetota bacterium]